MRQIIVGVVMSRPRRSRLRSGAENKRACCESPENHRKRPWRASANEPMRAIAARFRRSRHGWRSRQQRAQDLCHSSVTFHSRRALSPSNSRRYATASQVPLPGVWPIFLNLGRLQRIVAMAMHRILPGEKFFDGQAIKLASLMDRQPSPLHSRDDFELEAR